MNVITKISGYFTAVSLH